MRSLPISGNYMRVRVWRHTRPCAAAHSSFSLRRLAQSPDGIPRQSLGAYHTCDYDNKRCVEGVWILGDKFSPISFFALKASPSQTGVDVSSYLSHVANVRVVTYWTLPISG